jgi:hypothetical protein
VGSLQLIVRLSQILDTSFDDLISPASGTPHRRRR